MEVVMAMGRGSIGRCELAEIRETVKDANRRLLCAHVALAECGAGKALEGVAAVVQDVADSLETLAEELSLLDIDVPVESVLCPARTARAPAELRNEVLVTLKMLYPAALQGDQLLRTRWARFPQVEWDQLKRDLAYLCEKGYVQRILAESETDARITPWGKQWFRLTSGGVEVADKAVRDKVPGAMGQSRHASRAARATQGTSADPARRPNGRAKETAPKAGTRRGRRQDLAAAS